MELKCGQLLLSVPAVQGNDRVFDLRILSRERFPIVKSTAKSKVLTTSLSPGGGAYSRALKAEKS